MCPWPGQSPLPIRLLAAAIVVVVAWPRRRFAYFTPFRRLHPHPIRIALRDERHQTK
jgi:hypothetical protein